MVSIKPEILRIQNFLHALLDDVLFSNGKKNTDGDKKTITSRLNKEGIGFATKTLPKLGKCIDLSLKTGVFVGLTAFRRYKNSALPCFLRGLLFRIFDSTGLLREEPDLAAIAEIRQICFVFYKYVTEFTADQQCAAREKFVKIDQGLPSLSQALEDPFTYRVLSEASYFLENLFTKFDPKDIIPSHGPGIVASGEKPHEKRHFRTQYKEIHNEYPYYRYFVVNTHHLSACVDDYNSRRKEIAGINKVLFVPKDSRGPRTIACEPLEYMWIQQGLRKSLYSWIETHPLTRGRINFTDQTINQRLACEASYKRTNLVTVDLKDASDSVSNELVQFLFSRTSLSKPLAALRTPVSLLPDGSTVDLKKYAAMGSALCFPVEALVFYSLIEGIHAVLGKTRVVAYVYGDDIITDREIYPIMRSVFQSVGLVVNDEKSCTTGFFRESCGAEYFKGHDVSYIKIRKTDASSPDGLVSIVETSNLLFERCYYNAAKYAEKVVKPYCSVPFGFKQSSYLNYFNDRFKSFYQGVQKTRWNVKFQILESLKPVVTGLRYETPNVALPDDEELEIPLRDRYAEYLRKLTQGWSDLFRSGSYAKRGIKIKRRYVQNGT